MKDFQCHTGDMTADFYTKPLQGAMFCNFRDKIMGVVSQPYPGPGKKEDHKNSLDKSGYKSTVSTGVCWSF